MVGISDKQKVNYLMMWMDHEGEPIIQNLPQEVETKPEEYSKAFESHIVQQINSVLPDTAFSQLQQDKSDPVESFVVKYRNTWNECQFP